MQLAAFRDDLEMAVRFQHNDGQRESHTTIKLQSGRAARNVFPDGYDSKPVVIQSSDF